jgi:hypothetical protein
LDRSSLRTIPSLLLERGGVDGARVAGGGLLDEQALLGALLGSGLDALGPLDGIGMDCQLWSRAIRADSS